MYYRDIIFCSLPSDFFQITMECITTARMNVLWERGLTEDFRPSRGIRQGDPISPYIFVLCIERLSHGICHEVNLGRWNPVYFSCHGTPLTHLFFADDLLLLAEASREQTIIINLVLDAFCDSSGAKVNKSKTQVFFSKNISAAEANSNGSVLGVSITNNLGKYRGMLLLQSRVSKNTYRDFIDRVQQRLSGWNEAQLSLAGRITPAQSIIQAIPIYAMQTTNLPLTVKSKIDQACKRFIWSGVKTRADEHGWLGYDVST